MEVNGADFEAKMKPMVSPALVLPSVKVAGADNGNGNANDTT